MKTIIACVLVTALVARAQDPTRWIDHVTPIDEPFETYIIITNFLDIPAEIAFHPLDKDGHPLSSIDFQLMPFQTVKSKSDDIFGTQPVSHFQITGNPFCVVTVGYQLYDGQGATAHLVESPGRFDRFVMYPGEAEYVFDGMAAVNFGDAPALITAIVRDASGATIKEVTFAQELEPLHKGLWLIDKIVTEDTASIAVESTQPLDVTLLRGTRPDVVPGYLFEVTPISEPSNEFKRQ